MHVSLRISPTFLRLAHRVGRGDSRWLGCCKKTKIKFLRRIWMENRAGVMSEREGEPGGLLRKRGSEEAEGVWSVVVFLFVSCDM